MAVYTMELRTLIKNNFPVFDDSWTTYVPDYKRKLIDKIVKHYYFYEIGQETPERFRHYLNEKLALIMPYYNQLYRSELLELKPLYDHLIEESQGTDRQRDFDRTLVGRKDDNAVKSMANSIQRMLDTTGSLDQSVQGTKHGEWEEHDTGTKNVTTDEDTTDKTVGKETYTGKDATVGKETMDEATTGKTDTTGDSQRDTTNIRRYSDTPQGVVSTSGVDIDNRYLTNYTKDTGTEHIDTSTHETASGTDNKTTDTTSTVDSTHTKDNTVDETGTRDVTEATATKEDKNGSSDEQSTSTTGQTTTGTEHGKEFSNGSEQNTASSLESKSEGEKEKEKTEVKRVTKGFMVSQSALLKEYRKTFLNIDRSIIEDIADCFMGIF